MKRYTSFDEYLGDFDATTQKVLKKLKQVILEAVPEADLTFAYGIPTFKVRGKTVVHFAAYKSHIGLYPGPRAIEAHKDELKGYKTSKGTVQFPLDQSVPYDLIKKITNYAGKSV